MGGPPAYGLDRIASARGRAGPGGQGALPRTTSGLTLPSRPGHVHMDNSVGQCARTEPAGRRHRGEVGMAPQFARYVAERPAGLAEGWTLDHLTPPSRLFGANGLRTGADGRIYVAQVSGSQISAIDPETGAVEAIAPMGGGIVGPDDL